MFLILSSDTPAGYISIFGFWVGGFGCPSSFQVAWAVGANRLIGCGII